MTNNFQINTVYSDLPSKDFGIYSEYTVFIWKLFAISSNSQKIYKLLLILFIIKLYARINIFIL